MIATVGRLTVEFDEINTSVMSLTKINTLDGKKIPMFLQKEEVLALEDLIQIYKRGLK